MPLIDELRPPSLSEYDQPEPFLSAIRVLTEKSSLPMWLAVCRSKGVSHTDAIDIIQDVLLSIWESRLAGFDKKKSVRAYLCAAIRNKSVDFIRRGRSQLKSLKEYGARRANETRKNHDSDDAVELQETIDFIRQKLKNLVSEEDLAIFEQHRFQDKSHQEIAESRQLSVQAIRKRYSRVLGILRPLFRAEFMEETKRVVSEGSL